MSLLRLSAHKSIMAVVVVAGVFAMGAAALKNVMAAGQNSNAAAPAATTPVPAVSPQSPQVVAGTSEARKLLLLMDTNKNGKVSRTEFMAFMAAEFDRLDVNHDGELDVKELEQSQLAAVHRGAGHR